MTGLHWNRGLGTPCQRLEEVHGKGYPPELGHLQGERPIGSSQGPNNIRSTGCQNVVDRVGGSNDALSAGHGSASREPADDIAGFLIMEGLQNGLSSSPAFT